MEQVHGLSSIEHDGNCHSMERAIRLLGDTWTLMIVYNLVQGFRRFGELHEALGNISPKTLSQRLKLLETAGFVERRAFAEIPPRVEYSLTEKGQALVGILAAIREFSEKYLPDEPAPCTSDAADAIAIENADIPI